jgi:hypothetical protein
VFGVTEGQVSVTMSTGEVQTLSDIAHDVVRAAVAGAVAKAFEEMVFIEPKLVADTRAMDETQIYAQLRVCAPLSCLITLQMSSSLVDACVDVLYCGVEGNATLRQDVVKELVNMVSGLLMSNLSESSRIELGLPTGGLGAPSLGGGYVLTNAFLTDAGGLQVTLFE